MKNKQKRKDDFLEKKSHKELVLNWALRKMATAVLQKYQPKIVAITGSVGKTSAKEAVALVLGAKFRVGKSEKNYNNEIGVPLTIIRAEAGGKSLWRWLGVFLRWLGTLFFSRDYPEVLVLEMGADRVGDIQYLTSFVKPDIAIITDISSSHLEYFKNIEAIIREKSILAKVVKAGGLAIFNGDNPHLVKLKISARQNGIEAELFSFGFSDAVEVRASDVLVGFYGDQPSDSGFERIPGGLSFKLSHVGSVLPMRLNNVLAKHSIYAALAGVSAGIGMGMNLVEIGASLEEFTLPPGRTTLLKGIKETRIIDDTYNSSTIISVEGALEILREFEKSRKVVVLGDILEIGSNTEQEHRLVAKKFLEIDGAVFFAVGRRMLFAVDELKKHGFSGEVQVFSSPLEVGRKLQEILRKGDVVLVKGSQGMRMEKVVEEIMAEPERAGELLCRQNKEWKNKPWKEI